MSDPFKVLDHTVQHVKTAKHWAFLGKKWLKRTTYPVRQKLKDALFRFSHRLKPYEYLPERYPGEFITATLGMGSARSLDRVIYCFWTGDNELSPNRRAGLDSLIRRNSDVDVRLITPANLDEYILPDMPLHSAFEYLSLVHRSDYLRCYFMNFWGGGYCDIKTINESWSPAFDKLANSSDKWALGYREIASDMTSTVCTRLGKDVRRHYSLLIGNGAFIMKAQTPLTREWYAQLLNRMDFYADALAEAPGDTRGKNPGYPIPWIDMLGNVLPPIALKYHQRLIQDETIRPNFTDYQ